MNDDIRRLFLEIAEDRLARQPIRVKIALPHNGRLRWGSAGEFQTAPSSYSHQDKLAWARHTAMGMRSYYDETDCTGVVVGIFQGRRLLERFE